MIVPTKYTVTSSVIVLPKPVVDGIYMEPTDAATSNYPSPQRDGQVNESTKNG